MPGGAGTEDPRRPWEVFADALLRREALRSRVGEGLEPHDLAGVVVDHTEVDRLLRQLPGLDGPAEQELRPIEDALGPVVSRARQRLHESAAARADRPRGGVTGGADAFDAVVAAAGLSAREIEVLAVLGAVELDPRRQRLVAYLQDSIELPRPTLAGLRRLFGGDPHVVGTVAPTGRLARAELVELAGTGPWSNQMVGLAPRVVWALAGVETLDRDLPAGRRLVDTAASGPQEQDTGEPVVILVPGGDPAGRLRAAVSAAPGTRFLVCPCPDESAAWAAVVREATVRGVGVVLELADELPDRGRVRIGEADHLAWTLCSPRELPLESLPERPWREVAASPGRDLAVRDGPAGVNGAEPRLPSRREELLARAREGLGGDHHAAVRRLASGALDRLAVRVRPRRGWDDLVLPADQLAQLHELVARERERDTVYGPWGFRPLPSEGVVAVFSGPSGTGKTLAAEIIAGELGLDLYKVDLSAVVSKYIGETEKNLERVFGAAAVGNVVLFFDEADALFGKRSEVGDAHDRYANIEVAYLLQRLETYDGLVLLASNLQRNMDTAFLRRIHVAVAFPLPDLAQRRDLWRWAFPPECPTTDLDLEFLAERFDLSGGSIHNAALGAAFLAAEQDTAVSMDLVVLALKREFQKLGRLRTEEEFGRFFALVSA